jgi:hypothetical protein
MSTTIPLGQNRGFPIKRRNREPVKALSGSAAVQVLAAMDGAALQQKELGLGDPSVAVDRTKKRMRTHILRSQANELAELFTPIASPDPQVLPRAEKFDDFLPTLPDAVICRLKPGTTHTRCTVGRGIPNLMSKRYEAPIPVVPSTVLELASRAKEICPDLEFHVVLKPSWTEVPQSDPILLGKVPELDEYFEIGAWDGDSAFLSDMLQSADPNLG